MESLQPKRSQLIGYPTGFVGNLKSFFRNKLTLSDQIAIVRVWVKCPANNTHVLKMLEIKIGEVYNAKGHGPMVAVSSPDTQGMVCMRAHTNYTYSVHIDKIAEISDSELESYGSMHKWLFPLSNIQYWINQHLAKRRG